MRDYLLCAVLFCVFSRSLAQTARHVTDAERQEALDAHNQARSEVALEFGVENMPELVWNDSLAEIGLTYLQSQNCLWGHNPNRGFTGENIAAGQQSWHAAIYDGWFASEEEAYFTGNGVDGHYTQVTWADTTTVGCAWCSVANANGQQYQRYYVCNYYPPGNFNGQTPWDEGNGACLNCAEGQSCTTDPFSGLCTTGAGGPPPTTANTTTITTVVGETTTAAATTTTSPTGTGDNAACGEELANTIHENLGNGLIGLEPGSSPAECCAICSNLNGCVSYSLVPAENLSNSDVDLCLLYPTAIGAGSFFPGVVSANVGQ